MLILSRLYTSPKATTKAKFVKYLNDKTVVFNNLQETWLSTLSHSRLHSLTKSTGQSFSDFQLCAAVRLWRKVFLQV